MNQKEKSKERLNASIKVSTKLLQSKKGEETPNLIAYAYSQGGRILAQAPIDAEGGSTLNFSIPNVRNQVRVVVGPEIEKNDNGIEASLAELIRRGAKERFICLEQDNCTPQLAFDIFPDTWKCWMQSFCLVKGTLIKKVGIGTSFLDLPVCDAQIEVYEVDPFYLWVSKLKDIDIERIRKYILDPPPPIKIPQVIEKWQLLPLDGPVPIPEFKPEQSENFLTKNQSSFQQNLSGDISLADKSQSAIFQNDNSLLLQARTASTSEFRNVLIDNSRLIRPIYCLLFPSYVTKKLVATTTTDDCGRFQAFFFKGCNNQDTPDLYFRATQNFFNWTIAIYDPKPIQCNIYWNYTSGTEVNLITKHALAKTCLPCPPVNAPNNWVLVSAIGNHPLSLIHGTGESLSSSTDAVNIGLTDSGAPFGGFLRLRMEFDNSLREDLNIKYYRVSWWKGEMQDFDSTTDEFVPLTLECHRHYTHEVDNDLVLEVLSLGPKVINGEAHLFEIPPALPPKPNSQYSYPDLKEDLTNAKFPSNVFLPGMDSDNVIDTSGKIQLKIDLFDSDGNLVNISTQNIKYRVPTSTDLTKTIETEDAAEFGLIQDEDNDGLKSFIMTLHIDNNKCSAEIADPKIGDSLADECGVLRYDSGDLVELPFTASHPNGFANYNFNVVRGVTPNVASKNGPVGTGISDSVIKSINEFTGDCAVAGFSEILGVTATATNGFSRLSGYDASRVRAFVLAPQEE